MAIPQVPASQRPSRQRGGSVSPEQAPGGAAKLGGVFWWLIFGLMAISDLGTILCQLLVIVGLGLTATVLGAVVGIPIAALGWGGGVLISFNAFMFSTGYFWKNKVPLLQGRKIATWGVSAIIKLIPAVSMFPTLTLSFVIITLMENAKRGSGSLGAIVKNTVGKTPVGAVTMKVAGKVL